MYVIYHSEAMRSIIFHKCVLLVADASGYTVGEVVNEFEKEEMPWEMSNRRRLA